MSKLRRPVRQAQTSGAYVYGLVEDIPFGYATVRLGSPDGARLTNLQVVGGGVAVGDTVIVDYSAGVPPIVRSVTLEGEVSESLSTVSESVRHDAGVVSVGEVLNIGCAIRNSSFQNFTIDVLNVLTFNTEIEDTDDMVNLGANSTRITFKTAGVYIVGFNAAVFGTSEGDWDLSIRLNGTLRIVEDYLGNNTDSQWKASLVRRRWFDVDDYIECTAFPVGKANPRTIAEDESQPVFWAQKIGVGGGGGGGNGGDVTLPNAALNFAFYQGGGVLDTTDKFDVRIKFAGTIVSWSVWSTDPTCTFRWNVRKGTFSGYPTMSNIDGSDPPELSAEQKAESTALTGWTTAVAIGDIIRMEADNAVTPVNITRATVMLEIELS